MGLVFQVTGIIWLTFMVKEPGFISQLKLDILFPGPQYSMLETMKEMLFHHPGLTWRKCPYSLLK